MYGFWRSAASFRVRVALNLKGLEFEETFVDLDAGEQNDAAFLRVNPQGAVPALVDGDGPPLTQSLAILDYLEEAYPAVPLLPECPRGRARVRSLSQVVACDTHPLYVPRVRRLLMQEFDVTKDETAGFVRSVFSSGLRTLEDRLSREEATGRYCHGDAVSHADLCLVSLWVGTAIFGVDTEPFTTVRRIAEECLRHDGFARAHPLRQPGAPSR